MFESKGVDYIIKDPQKYKNKKVVISGGGDSALDWAIYLANGVAASTTLVHRRESFRGHPESVEKVNNMTRTGQINLITNSEVVGLQGLNSLKTLNIKKNLDNDIINLDTDYWIPLFGLTPS